MYGQSEASARLASLPPDEFRARRGSIGKPIAPGSMTAAELMFAVETWIEGEVQRLGSPLADAPAPQ